MNDINFVENLILVRNEPHIYAFSTNTIPNYLKIGDTFRPVDVRIEEWNKKISSALGSEVEVKLTKEFTETAVIDDAYFRDYSVHSFLRDSLGKLSIDVTDPDLVDMYSREFFKNVSVEDVKNAILDIKEDYTNASPEKKYTYYKLAEKKSAGFHWNHDQHWELRPNQEVVVSNFLAKRDKSELLMYAVMRFGKSFTAMYCALATHAQKVLIVSAKADVVSEWKATVEKPDCFSEYKFLVDSDFIDDKNAIQNAIDGGNKVAVFLTLQNLNGKDKDGHNIKNKLTDVFETEYDLIIVDETHFGAWAKNYGAALKAEEDSATVKEDSKLKDEFNERHSRLITKQKLHLSGTPYNLLYDKKFDSDNMIATVQFSDILNEKEVWDKTHFADIENGTINPTTRKVYQEFDNPYFGFPRMLRFAFNPTADARTKLSALSKTGKWTLTEMFSAKEGKFNHEEDVLKLLKIIDGSDSDEGILSFLDIPKIKEHDVCKHMVFVLPYKSSCDAMADLLNEHYDEFINLCQYKILNVAGHNSPSELSTIEKVKQIITNCENSEPMQKTITLTVNRMLTGVTVKEWDTMIMLKNTHSAQEYDQAVFRIQNQYVVEYEAADGNIMKKDMKPQTILVDFDPMRIFEIQGTSSNIVNAVSKRDESFEDALRTELKYFPIITYNGTNLVKVDANNIVEIITQYNNQKSILDEACDIDLDMDVLSNEYVASFIKAQSKLGLTNTLTADAHQGQQTDLDNSESEGAEADDATDNGGNNNTSTSGNGESVEENKEDKDLNQKFRMCMANILFYVFLSNSRIENLNDVISSLEEPENSERNIRIFNHLELDALFIRVLSEQCSTRFALEISNKIKNANLLSNDTDLTPKKRATNALDRFNRISESEVVTPRWICKDMINGIGINELVSIVENGGKILDIASKTGEFAYSIFELLKDKVSIKKLREAIYSIPTSGVTYEFTRRMYEILELNLDNLANVDFIDAYSMVKTTGNSEIDYDKIGKILRQNKVFKEIKIDDKFIEGDDIVNFDVVIGNPPYQIGDGGAQASAKPIYHEFVNISKILHPTYMTLIMPTRWYAGGKGLDNFRIEMLDDIHIKELHDYLHPEEVFPDTNNRGGICYFLRNSDYDNTENLVNVVTHNENNKLSSVKRPMRLGDIDIFIRKGEAVSILEKVIMNKAVDTMDNYISARKPFGIESNIIKTKDWHKSKSKKRNLVLCYGKGQSIGYVSQEKITSNIDVVKQWKVFTPRANNIGTELNDDNLNTFVGAPNSICTEAYLILGYNIELDANSARNLAKYFNTKFVRFMHSIAKASHDASRSTYRFVPKQNFTSDSDIDWNKCISEIDAQLYLKYEFTKEEISLIESTIKPME